MVGDRSARPVIPPKTLQRILEAYEAQYEVLMPDQLRKEIQETIQKWQDEDES